MTFLPSVWSASICFTACNSSPSIRSKALHHVPGTTGTDALTTGAADLFRNPPGKFAHIRIKDPAASNGVFDPRGSRQISMQARIFGSLLAGINAAFKVSVQALHRLHEYVTAAGIRPAA